MRRKYQPQYNDKGERWCERCKAYHQSSNFSKESRQPDGLNRWCKGCVSVYQKKYNDEHREEVNARIRNRRHERGDEFLSVVRLWARNNPDKVAGYRDDQRKFHKDRLKQHGLSARAKRSKVPGHITATELRELWDQQGGKWQHLQCQPMATTV